MSRRSKIPRTVLPRYIEESNSEFEDYNSENENSVHTALKKYNKRTNKKKTTKKAPVTKRTVTVAKKSGRAVPEVINLDVDSDSRENDLSEALKDNHQKNVQTKVDSFFKSSNLISDDDDEPLTAPQIKKSTVVSKEFYELTDSDDEVPSTSVTKTTTAVTKTTTSYSWSTTNLEVHKPMNDNKEEELWEIVDEILESSGAPVETNPEPDSWNVFNSKTEEILGSVKALLGSLKDNKESKIVDLAIEEEQKPQKEKRTCPICMEVLAETVVPGATVCGHIFCMECIKQVVRTSKSCPTCRKRITMKQIHPLYL